MEARFKLSDWQSRRGFVFAHQAQLHTRQRQDFEMFQHGNCGVRVPPGLKVNIQVNREGPKDEAEVGAWSEVIWQAREQGRKGGREGSEEGREPREEFDNVDGVKC